MADGLRFFQDGAFDPDITSAMGEAFDRPCKSLHDMGQPDIVKEIIAKRIVEVARTGERDPVQLCERALAALGFNPPPSHLLPGISLALELNSDRLPEPKVAEHVI
jgi:hypothetical protein